MAQRAPSLNFLSILSTDAPDAPTSGYLSTVSLSLGMFAPEVLALLHPPRP
jgi:hypothetical protein